MATQGTNITVTFVASEAFTNYQYHVIAGTTGSRAVTTITALGVVTNKPSAIGEAACVVVQGHTKAYAGGTITIGALLDVTASGTLQVATSGDAYFAQALSACASGAIFDCIVRGPSYNRGL